MFSSFIFGLFDLISAPPLSLSQIGYAIVLLCLVCFAGSLYLGFRVWNSHVRLGKAELCFVSFFGLAGLQDSGMCVVATGNDRDCRKALALGFFVFKPGSWLAGDSRLRQTFSLRIHSVERQSLSP